MGRRRIVATWGTAVAALAAGAVPVARAEEPARAPPRTVLFASFDAGNSGFASIGAKRALSGSLDERGPVAMATVGAGGSPDGADFGRFQPTVQGSALLGYQWALGRTFLSLFAGAEVDRDRFARQGAPAREETRLGARLQGEVWMHPTDATLLTATAIGGTARRHLWARASAGYKVWEGVFVGPEATHYRTDTYREWRLGLHATGIRLGAFTFRLSGGWRREDDERRPGAYGGVSVHVKM